MASPSMQTQPPMLQVSTLVAVRRLRELVQRMSGEETRNEAQELLSQILTDNAETVRQLGHSNREREAAEAYATKAQAALKAAKIEEEL